jgi:hypothetical protein
LEEARCVQQTSDNGYIFVGRTRSYGAGKESVWLVKTDAAGDTLWTKTYVGSLKDRGFSVQQTSDEGYILAARTESYGAGDWDFWLIKTDSHGDTMWTRTYGGFAKDGIECVQQTTDGGYIMAGGTESFGSGDVDCWLIKTDSNGDTLWTKSYGGKLGDTAESVQQTADGGYILTGVTDSFGHGLDEIGDVWLIKTDASGDTLWTKTYGDNLIDYGRYVQQTTDGGYILTGYTESYGFNNFDCWLIKTNATGDTVWTKTYGGPGEDEGRCVQETIDGGYIITGWFSTQVAIEDNIWLDFWLIKTDANGDTIWTRTYDGGVADEAYFVEQTTDKGYIIVGHTYVPVVDNPDVWLIKVAPDPSTNIAENLLITNYQLRIT